MEVKDILKQKRLEKGLTLDDVARLVGVSAPTILRWESGDIANMKRDKIVSLAKALGISPAVIMGWDEKETSTVTYLPGFHQYPIPLLATVAGGIPIYSEDHITGYVGFTKESNGHIFAVSIKGDSMSPSIMDGDVVIVDQDATFEENDICIVTVNGNDGTCKRVKKSAAGLTLISINPNYEPMFFSAEEVESIPVRIVGKVIQVQRNI